LSKLTHIWLSGGYTQLAIISMHWSTFCHSYNNSHIDNISVCQFGNAEHEMQFSSRSDRTGIYCWHIIDHTAITGQHSFEMAFTLSGK